MVQGIFFLTGSIAIILFGLDIFDEFKFFRKAVKTQGKIVRRIAATHKTYQQKGVDTTGRMPISTNDLFSEHKVNAGFLAVVEYETQDGDIYEVKSKQVVKTEGDFLEVAYLPDAPTIIAIDGYYLSGKSKYIGFFFGIALFLTGFPLSYVTPLK